MMKEVMRVNGDNNSSLCANLTSCKKSGKLNVGITAIPNTGRQCPYEYGSTATENSCTVSSTPMHSTAGTSTVSTIMHTTVVLCNTSSNVLAPTSTVAAHCLLHCSVNISYNISLFAYFYVVQLLEDAMLLCVPYALGG